VAQVPVHLLGVPADGPGAAAQDRQLHQPLADQRLKAGAQRTLPRLSVLGQDSQRLLDVDRGRSRPLGLGPGLEAARVLSEPPRSSDRRLGTPTVFRFFPAPWHLLTGPWSPAFRVPRKAETGPFGRFPNSD
jgi:hypothetical protein